MKQPAWVKVLQYDPIMPLVTSLDKAVRLHAEIELLNSHDVNYTTLWDSSVARAIIKKQQPDGSWLYPGGNAKVRSAENYNQIETFRNLGYLVELYGFTASHPAIVAAAEFLFRFQTTEGDIRGILGNQYTPYYTAAIAELLIKAGYADDARIKAIFAWLYATRQDDGGWAIPLRTRGKNLDAMSMDIQTLQPNTAMPYSHMVTGMVLRAYAAHSVYRNAPEAKIAGHLLLTSLFKKDSYPDRSSPDFWTRFTYPFWFTDLISALDTLAKLGFTKDEKNIQAALSWLIARQEKNGLWKLKTLKNQKKFNTNLWLSLAVCRIVKRLYEGSTD